MSLCLCLVCACYVCQRGYLGIFIYWQEAQYCILMEEVCQTCCLTTCTARHANARGDTGERERERAQETSGIVDCNDYCCNKWLSSRFMTATCAKTRLQRPTDRITVRCSQDGIAIRLPKMLLLPDPVAMPFDSQVSCAMRAVVTRMASAAWDQARHKVHYTG